MASTIPLLLLGLLPLVAAHTSLDSFNGRKDCLRKSNPKSTYPIRDPNSKDMMCNVLGNSPAQATCDVQAGSTIKLNYVHSANYPDKISESHKGPCSVYLSRPGSNQWAKVYEQAYDPSRGGWCTMKMRDDNGKYDFTLPKEVPSGKWIMRVEMTALHQARDPYPKGGPQSFIRCIDINVQGSSQGELKPTISIPGPQFMQMNTPGINFDIYKNKNNYGSYKMFGPPLAVPASVGGGSYTNSTADAGSQGGSGENAYGNKPGKPGKPGKPSKPGHSSGGYSPKPSGGDSSTAPEAPSSNVPSGGDYSPPPSGDSSPDTSSPPMPSGKKKCKPKHKAY